MQHIISHLSFIMPPASPSFLSPIPLSEECTFKEVQTLQSLLWILQNFADNLSKHFITLMMSTKSVGYEVHHVSGMKWNCLYSSANLMDSGSSSYQSVCKLDINHSEPNYSTLGQANYATPHLILPPSDGPGMWGRHTGGTVRWGEGGEYPLFKIELLSLIYSTHQHHCGHSSS